MINSEGTIIGKWINVGSRTVVVGIESDRVESLLLSNFCKSLVMCITVIAAMKLLHSMAILVRLLMPIGRPYVVWVRGHKS